MNVRLLLVVLVVANVASAIAVVYARHLHRQAFATLTALQHVRDELDIEFGRLQLEQATWAETNRIEQVATERVGMLFPAAPELVMARP